MTTTSGISAYASMLARLRGLARFGMRPGLDRIEAVLAALAHPERRFPSLHIAGTNGKGSTAAFVEAMLRAEGLRVGLYTSPHLQRFTERVRIDGAEVGSELMAQALARVFATPLAETLTFFEVATSAAYLCFADADVDVAVVECGLGGRLDATGTCRAVVCGLTRIGLDHAEVLGDTVEKIAFEKAGIARAGVPLVGGPLEVGPRQVIEEVATRVGAPLFLAGRDFGVEAQLADGNGARFGYWSRPRESLEERRLEGLALGLDGLHQADNAALACAMVSLLDADLRPSERAMREGLAAARWPARLERVAADVRIDGAHNPDGAEALARALLAAPGRRRPLTLVIGLLADKDPRGVLAPLLAVVDRVICTNPPSERALSASDLADAAREVLAATMPSASGPGPSVEVVAVPETAIDMARDGADVVVCGSLYLAGAARAYLLGEPSDPVPVADPIGRAAR